MIIIFWKFSAFIFMFIFILNVFKIPVFVSCSLVFICLSVLIILHLSCTSRAVSTSIIVSFSNVLIILLLSLIFALYLYIRRVLSGQSEYLLLVSYLTTSLFYPWVILESGIFSTDDVSITVSSSFSFMYAFLNAL